MQNLLQNLKGCLEPSLFTHLLCHNPQVRKNLEEIENVLLGFSGKYILYPQYVQLLAKLISETSYKTFRSWSRFPYSWVSIHMGKKWSGGIFSIPISSSLDSSWSCFLTFLTFFKIGWGGLLLRLRSGGVWIFKEV